MSKRERLLSKSSPQKEFATKRPTLTGVSPRQELLPYNTSPKRSLL